MRKSMGAQQNTNIFQSGGFELDFGRADSLRHHVLSWVLHQNYDKAIEKLKEYISTGSDYPQFQEKTARFVSHCIDLVYAIKAKRNFPGLDSLTQSKQKELSDKYKMHIVELQGTLMRIEIIYENLRILDVRSTVYVIKAVWLCGFAIAGFAFVLELYNGLASTSNTVVLDVVDRLLSSIFS